MLVLGSSANSYQGGTTINAGVLSIAADNRLGEAGDALAFGGGALRTTSTFTMTRAVTLNAGGGTLAPETATTLTYNGVIGGTGGLTMDGGIGSILILGNANSYQGGTSLRTGLLSVSADDRLGAASGTLTFMAGGGGGILLTTATFTMSRATTMDGIGGFEVAAGTTLTQNGAIGGAGALVKRGAGTLVLGGVNSHTGDIIVSAGTLALSGAGSIADSNSLTVNAGATFDISLTTSGASVSSLSDTASGGDINLGSQTLTITSELDFTGIIKDGGLGGGAGGGLTIAGPGGAPAIAFLKGTNTYTGATTIGENATLELDDNGSISSSSVVNLTGNGAVFDISCGCINPQTIKDLQGVAGSTVRLGNNTLTLGTANSTTFAGVIDDFGGNGGLIKQGSGTLTLTGANEYTGGTTINAGAIAVSSDGGLGDASGGITFNGGALRFLASFNLASTRAITLNAGGGTIDTGSFDTTISQAIGGTGGLTKAGAGALILSAANGYSGATTISGGALVLTGAGSIAASTGVNLTDATAGFDVSGSSGAQTIQDLSGVADSIVALGSNSLTVGTSNSTTFSGGINGWGVFIKQGSGTLTLEGQSIFTGAVTINAGTLALADFGDLSLSSLVTVATGATFDISASSFPFSGIGNLAGGGTVQLGNMGLVLVNASGEFGGSIVDSGYGGLQIFGGSITLTGVSTYRNVTQIWQGASLALKDAGSIADSLYIAFALNSTGTATFDISQTTAGASVGGLYDPFGIGVVSLGGKTLTITNGTGTFNGVIQDGGVGGGTGGALTLAASAQQGLGGINTYTGATTIGLDAVLRLMGGGSIATSSGVDLAASGATLDISSGSGDKTIRDLTGVAGSMVELGSNTLTAGTSNSTTFGGVIDGLGGFTKAGSGTLTFTGVNTYTGVTTVSGGTLAISGGGSIATSSGVNLTAAGATFDITGSTGNQTIQDLSGVADSVVALGNRTLTAGSSNSTTFSGVISDNGLGGALGGSFTKVGSGKLTLEGINTYTGATTISAGTLALANDGSITHSSVVTVSSGATFDITGIGGLDVATIRNLAGSGSVLLGNKDLEITHATGEFGGQISGNAVGTLVVSGGTLTLTGVSTYTSTTAIGRGATLALKGSGSIDNTIRILFDPRGPTVGTFDISQTNSGASVGGLEGDIGIVELGSKQLTITSGTMGFPFVFGGVIKDGGIGGGTGGSLVIAENAAQVLTGENTYTGATTVGKNAYLALDDGGKIATSSSLNLTGDGAIFDIGCSCLASVTVQNLSGSATSFIFLGANRLTVVSSVNTTFAGTIDP